MKTNVAETSLIAWNSLVKEQKLAPQEQRVVHAIEAFGSQTREELANATGLRLSAVCGRVNALIASGVLSERGTRINPASRKANKLVCLASAQRDLFGGH